MLEFRPGHCENPTCRRLVIWRTDWLSIERGGGRGHGYHVCRKCTESLIPNEHNEFIRLMDIANGFWLRSYKTTKMGWRNKMLTVEEAQTEMRKLAHNCGYCQSCPTHGY